MPVYLTAGARHDVPALTVADIPKLATEADRMAQLARQQPAATGARRAATTAFNALAVACWAKRHARGAT